jgi:hypothetical protein
MRLLFIFLLCLTVNLKSENINFEEIKFDLTKTRNYYLFKDNIIFRSNKFHLEKFLHRRELTNTFYRFDIKTKNIDSIKIEGICFLTFDCKLNDSLFVIGYYDRNTIVKVYEGEKNLDSIFNIVENIEVYNSKLILIDKGYIKTSISKRQFRTIYASYLEDKTYDININQTISKAEYSRPPQIANSYGDLRKKYSIIFKYNNFWCKETEITHTLSTTDVLRPSANDESHYWHILLDEGASYSNLYQNPVFFQSDHSYFTNSQNSVEFSWKYRKEKDTYYWNNQIKIIDSFIGKTACLILPCYRDTQILIICKTLPYKYFNQSKQMRLAEEYYSLKQYAYVKDRLQETVINMSDTIIPVSIITLSNNTYGFNATSKKSTRKLLASLDGASNKNGNSYDLPYSYVWYPFLANTYVLKIPKLTLETSYNATIFIDSLTRLKIDSSQSSTLIYKQVERKFNLLQIGNFTEENSMTNIHSNSEYILIQNCQIDLNNEQPYVKFFIMIL